MKGIVFTEFLEMVEKNFGLETLDEMLENTSVATSGSGIYTAVGNYPHEEMSALVNQLSAQSKIPRHDLMKRFGHYLFRTFSVKYSAFIESADTAFDLLQNIDSYIHPEVRKLYPEANPPSFKVLEQSDTQLVLQYKSNRRLWSLALGLIEGCLLHYGEKAEVTYKLLEPSGADVLFTVQKSV